MRRRAVLTRDRARLRAADPVPVTVRVPAKVNLQLSVGPRRPDGFHELATVFQAVSLYDEVTVAPAGRTTVRVTGEGAGEVPTGADNLAVRAVRALAELTGRRPAVRITIRKGIPVAGGMAGGSADAAAALLAADTLWGTGVPRETLQSLAAGVGSDVPFALHGGTALGRGRGERLSAVLGTGEYHWVFALADEGLSTAAVYAELDRVRPDAPPPCFSDELLAALRAGDPAALGRALANDLQDPALRLRPGLRRLVGAGADLGALGAVVSGSGPTVAFLARSSAKAVDLAAALAGTGLCRSVRRAVGPVPGARVVEVAG